ncbi:hypothetical protein SIN8267_02662 [Sinobacterium norvegicum]|uniref:BLUF domain-containing protein n=1 Tax=Sinobacterium norvegicum TaxID=1641715 RepID=A0ABN8EMP5_9GAMM|nr:BLUF domain-containing protein [Sinobacterium norvegicum]CAH0992529.1 hypothetical protein SIN8267_02662 [Sinobacterium norvegicum]
MHLIRLVYASKVEYDLEEADINAILNASKQNNLEKNITGALCYSNRFFLQCLEGSRLDVNALYHHILADGRHSQSAILQYSEIDQREFDDWSMGYIPPALVSGQLISKFSGKADFDPYSMSGESCYLLLKALASLGITES